MDDSRSSFDIAQSLADAAKAMDVSGTLEDTLDAIAYAARDAVPGFDHVGVSVMRRDGSITTMASTDRLVRALDTLQYKVDEGPCLDAMRQETLVLVEELSQHASHWPRYVPWAADAGVRSQMGVRVHSGDVTFGGLNFYSTEADIIDAAAPRHAQLFAVHAGIALSHAQHVDQSSAVIQAYRVAQAVGILMERFELTEQRARHLLVRVAAGGDQELHDLAAELIDEAGLRDRAP